MESWHLTTLTDCTFPKFNTTLSSLHCMALSLGIMVGLAGGLEQLLIKLFLLSIVGEACTVNLCWKSVYQKKRIQNISRKTQIHFFKYKKEE